MSLPIQINKIKLLWLIICDTGGGKHSILSIPTMSPITDMLRTSYSALNTQLHSIFR